ncbi:cytidine deaminase [Natronomonas sp. F2-12]|jgi:cytidine deaminase|uniref:cytidine deaminase n=1 Tax=Natronomonas aquatica TaxID=2841590 RepID=A0A9R1CRM1_9EURY|nr:cytidine deaminase [Natronomonas aquatica]MCQ4332553.1 cytidine deaminase [Natronomonas aquatica]
MEDEDLLAVARKAVERSYAPYSEYSVGAAIETADGTVFTGSNIENANYSNSVHAEELAISKAIEEGHRSFERIAVSSGRRDGVTPCGMCRQSLSEFCAPELRVICDEKDTTAEYTLGELLPNTITGGHLE